MFHDGQDGVAVVVREVDDDGLDALWTVGELFPNYMAHKNDRNLAACLGERERERVEDREKKDKFNLSAPHR